MNRSVYEQRNTWLKTDLPAELQPEFYLSNKLDIDIDDKIKECPLIDKFFGECVGEEYKEMLYETIAYSLFSSFSIRESFVGKILCFPGYFW